MFGEVVLIALAVVCIWAFIDIQRYIAHPDRKAKADEWFASFLDHNKESFSDPKLAWRYNVIENLFDGG